mmetsp:Transcript_486/g.979  ORF Transcript_486/g.979 Transcript_486/m.979 type:complete len:222 (-) Transcript_486:8-673(-)
MPRNPRLHSQHRVVEESRPVRATLRTSPGQRHGANRQLLQTFPAATSDSCRRRRPAGAARMPALPHWRRREGRQPTELPASLLRRRVPSLLRWPRVCVRQGRQRTRPRRGPSEQPFELECCCRRGGLLLRSLPLHLRHPTARPPMGGDGPPARASFLGNVSDRQLEIERREGKLAGGKPSVRAAKLPASAMELGQEASHRWRRATPCHPKRLSRSAAPLEK